MTESEVRAECQDCGLDHLSASRLDRLVLLAARKVYTKHQWPFRFLTESGTAPLDVAYRGVIKSVFDDEGTWIEPVDKDELDINYDLTVATGKPVVWYLDDDGDVATYPASGETITVRHYRSAPTTTADLLAAIPEQFHYAVVAEAVRRGKIDNSEPESAASYKQDFDDEIAEMRRVLFNEQVQAPKRLNSVG